MRNAIVNVRSKRKLAMTGKMRRGTGNAAMTERRTVTKIMTNPTRKSAVKSRVVTVIDTVVIATANLDQVTAI